MAQAIDPTQIMTLLLPILSFAIGIASGYAKWGKFKAMWHDVRGFVDNVDDDFSKESVTKDDVIKTWGSLKKVIQDIKP